MNKTILISLIILLISAIAVSAEIPSELLDQQIVEWDETQPEGDTRIMLLVNEEENIFNIKAPSVETKLADFRVSSEDDLKGIADSFVKNSEDLLEVASSDLKITEVVLSPVETEFDYHSPSGSVWYEQFYHDIPVYDGRLGIQINAYGTIYSVDYRLARAIDAPYEATLTADEALAKAEEHYGQTDLKLVDESKLYILNNKLVWRVNINLPVGREAFFDAATGDFVSDRQNFVGEDLRRDDADGGPTVTGGEVEQSQIETTVQDEADAAKSSAKPAIFIITAIICLLLLLAIVMFGVRKIRELRS